MLECKDCITDKQTYNKMEFINIETDKNDGCIYMIYRCPVCLKTIRKQTTIPYGKPKQLSMTAIDNKRHWWVED